MSSTLSPRSHLLVLALILALAVGLRVFSLGQQGFWTDELCSLSDADGWGLQLDKIPLDRVTGPMPICTKLSSARPIGDVIPGVAVQDAHPPIYFVSLRLWENCFGDSEAAVRSLCVVCSVIAVALLYFVVRQDDGVGPALGAALLMAVAVPQIQFSQEARNYMPAVMFSVAAALCLQLMLARPTPARTGAFGISLLALMMTHYYAAAVAAALVMHGVIGGTRTARWNTLVATAAAGVLFLVLWGRALHGQLQHLHAYASWLVDDGLGRLGRIAEHVARLPVRFVLDTADFGFPTLCLVVGAMGLASLPVFYFFHRPSRVFVLWAFMPIALVTAADVTGKTTEASWLRYSLMASPAMYALLATAPLPRRIRFVPLAIAVIAALLNLRTAYVPPWKVDFQTPATIIGRDMTADDAIIYSGPDPVQSSIAFAAFQHYLPTMPGTAVVLTKPADAVTTAALSKCRHVTVVWLWPKKSVGEFLPAFHAASSGGVPYLYTIYQGTLSPPRDKIPR